MAHFSATCDTVPAPPPVALAALRTRCAPRPVHVTQLKFDATHRRETLVRHVHALAASADSAAALCAGDWGLS